MSSGPNRRREGWTGYPMHYPCNSSRGKLGMVVTLQKNLSHHTKEKYKTVLAELNPLHATARTSDL